MICSAQARSDSDFDGLAREDHPAALRVRDSGDLRRADDRQFHDVRRRRRAGARVAVRRHRPIVRPDQIFVRPVGAAHERDGHVLLARLHGDRIGHVEIRAERRVGRRGGAIHALLVVEERDALAVDRDVDVLEVRSDAAFDDHAELIHPVGGEDVLGDDAAARTERRAVHVIPRMLRRERRRLVRRLRERGILVADRKPADGRRGVEVRVEQRRRKDLRVRDVVEVRALRVEREPVARADIESDQIADRVLVLGAVEPLKRARARIRFRTAVDHLLDCLDESAEGVAARTRGPGEGHHLGAQLPDHLLRCGESRRRCGHVVVL